jgi:hypothetical protein
VGRRGPGRAGEVRRHVVAFKRARVSDYGGRTLSGSGYEVNPSIPQAQSLSR